MEVTCASFYGRWNYSNFKWRPLLCIILRSACSYGLQWHIYTRAYQGLCCGWLAKLVECRMHQNAPQNKKSPGGGLPPDPLEVVGPESPPGARVTQNSRYVTDGLEMLMASTTRVVITSLQVSRIRIAITTAVTSLQVWLSLHLILAVQSQRQEFRKFRNTDRITPVE